MSESAPPLILTAVLPPQFHNRFTALRREHFPPERNFLDAHVTLFHALPAMLEDELRSMLGQLVREFAAPSGRVEGVMALGRGTAIRLASPAMLRLRELIAERLHGMLSAQDNHTPRLHVTIQNKVEPKEARALQALLVGQIAAEIFAFPGLALYAYRGGPWEALGSWVFRGTATA